MRIRRRFTCCLLFVSAKNRHFFWAQTKASNKTIMAEGKPSISLCLNLWLCNVFSHLKDNRLAFTLKHRAKSHIPFLQNSLELSESWEHMLREWEEESKHLGLFLLLVPATASSAPFFYSSYKHWYSLLGMFTELVWIGFTPDKKFSETIQMS